MSTTEGASPEPEKKPEPVKLEKVVPDKDELRDMGTGLFADMEAIVRGGDKLAADSAEKVKAAIEKEKSKARDKVWKYVTCLTDKNLAAIYKSFDSTKMIGNLPYEYVKYAIIQRFCDRALEESQSVLQPFQNQT